MENLPINEFLDWMKKVFYAGSVGSARFMGLSLFFPLFSWLQIRGVLRNTIIVALSVPNIALIYFALGDGPVPSIFHDITLVVKELAIGAVLGMLLGLPFWAAQIAGDVTDAFRGASAANLFDPVNANEISVTGTFLTLYTLVIFALIGGMPMLIDVLMRSFAAWPSATLMVDLNTATLAKLAEIGAQALFIALILAAPLLIALALVDIALIFAVRTGRSFPIYDLTNTFHNLIFIFILPWYALLLVEHFPPILRNMFTSVTALLPEVVK
jgi:type III secretion protein T